MGRIANQGSRHRLFNKSWVYPDHPDTEEVLYLAHKFILHYPVRIATDREMILTSWFPLDTSATPVFVFANLGVVYSKNKSTDFLSEYQKIIRTVICTSYITNRKYLILEKI
jgi:hypothetical protein